MLKHSIRKPILIGMATTATLWAAIMGCGGQATDSSDAVVVPDPSAVSSSAPAAKTGGAPAASTPTAAAPAASVTPVKAEGYGIIKGQVLFGGDAPTPKVLAEKGKAPKDPDVCAKNAPLTSERLVVDGATKGVKHVLVYLGKPTSVSEAAKKSAAAVQAEFDQKNCIFVPHVLGFMKGVEIKIKSSDPVNHNVNAKLRTAFNQLLAGGQSFPYTAQEVQRTPGEVTCDIHPWMKAWWMVLDHPYFAVTDSKGYYEIKDAPAGTQRLVVWQEAVRGGFVTASSGEDVLIKANDSTVKDFTIDPGKILPD
jgi:hypothetical protein